MNISIRNHIIDNFKESSSDEIRDSIEDAIGDKNEITLPGMGVFFEILWKNGDKDKIVDILKNNMKSA